MSAPRDGDRYPTLSETETVSRPTPAAVVCLVAASVVVLVLLPWAPEQAVFPPLPLGVLLAAAGFVAAAIAAACIGAVQAGPDEREDAVAVVGTWSFCGFALLTAVAAAATRAESLQAENVVMAQKFTSAFLVQQPVAAVIFLVTLAIAGDTRVTTIVFGPARVPRLAATLAGLAALSVLGATLFLGGFDGRLPAPLTLAVKAALVAVLAWRLHGWLRRVPPARQLGIAGIAGLLGLLNLGLALSRMVP